MYNVDFLQYALAKGVGEVAIKKALNFLKLNKDASWKDIITDKSILKLRDDIYTNIYKTENEAKILAEELYNNNVYMILENDLMYPERLKTTLRNNTPPVIFSVGNLDTDLKTAVGPCLSALCCGEHPSARGSYAFLPSGVAMVPIPCPTLAEILEVPP